MDLPPASPAGEADGHGDPERHAAPPAAPAARRPRGDAADTAGWHAADASGWNAADAANAGWNAADAANAGRHAAEAGSAAPRQPGPNGRGLGRSHNGLKKGACRGASAASDEKCEFVHLLVVFHHINNTTSAEKKMPLPKIERLLRRDARLGMFGYLNYKSDKLFP